MNIITQLLGDKANEIIGSLTSSAGLSTAQASSFLPEAIKSTISDISNQKIDLENSEPAEASQSILGTLDIGALASKVGISPELTTSGLETMMPQLLTILKEKAPALGGIEGISKLLEGGNSGIASMIGGLAKRFFGKAS